MDTLQKVKVNGSSISMTPATAKTKEVYINRREKVLAKTK